MVYDPFNKIADKLLDNLNRVGIRISDALEDYKNTEICKVSFEFKDKEERDRFLTLVTFGWALVYEIQEYSEYLRKLDKYGLTDEVNVEELRDRFYEIMEHYDKFQGL